MLVISQLAASGQRRAACFAALGVSVVALLWSALAVLGVNAIFAAHPHLRFALQLTGGLYLCYVALRLWHSGSASLQGGTTELTAPAAFRLGFVTNILNPKSALFFGSVFATSLPSAPPAMLLVGAVTVVLVNALVWHLFLALAFSLSHVQVAYAHSRKSLNRLASVLVGAFGLRLLAGAFAELKGR